MKAADLQIICHRCPQVDWTVTNRPPCKQNGKYFADNAEAGICQLNYFDHPEQIPITAAPSIAIPRERWPRAAGWLARRAKPEDRGIGDIVQRITDATGVSTAVYIAQAVKLLGNCGCKDRRERWNAMYPLCSAD